MYRLTLLLTLVFSLHAARPVELPVYFEPAGDGFLARAGSSSYSLTRSGGFRWSHGAEMRLVGASDSPSPSALDPRPGKSNYIRWDQPAASRTGVPQFGRVLYNEVYPGIDLVFYGNRSRVEFDFVVAAGASPERIVLEFPEAQSTRVDEGGDLLVRARSEELRLHRPQIQQAEEAIPGGYRLLEGNRVSFDIGPYDPSRPLVIDPIVSFADTFGEEGGTPIEAVAVDAAGNVFIAGTTASPIPLENPLQPELGGGNCFPGPFRPEVPCADIFVAKLDPSGKKLIYSTYIGGDKPDFAADLAVDDDGNAYVTGNTLEVGFEHQPQFVGPSQVFALKLNPEGTALLYRTELGGGFADARSIAIDGAGRAHIVGTNWGDEFPAVATGFPTSPGPRSLFVTRDSGSTWESLAADPADSSTVYAGSPVRGSGVSQLDAFVVKLDAAGSVLWAGLYGGSGRDEGLAVAVDSDGNVTLAGSTDSLDLPLENPIQGHRSGMPGKDAFVARFSPDGATLRFATYLGGELHDVAESVAADEEGNIYVAGSTSSEDFPTLNAFQPANVQYSSGFVAKIDPTSPGLVYSTYLGGAGQDSVSSIKLDPRGAVWVAGRTGSFDFPLVNPVQPSPTGWTSFVSRLAPDGSALELSTLFGGAATNAVAPAHNGVWLAGAVAAGPFPSVGGSPEPPQDSSGFLAHIAFEPFEPAEPGVPLVHAIYNAASYAPGDIASPGEILSIFGDQLSPGEQAAEDTPLPLAMQGVSVTIGGIPAPLFYVSSGQINLQVPVDLPLGPAVLTVTRGEVSSAERTLRLIPLRPAVFAQNGSGHGAPVIVHAEDWSLVTPDNPAHPGEWLIAFCTGLGPTTPPAPTGAAAPVIPAPTDTPFRTTVNLRWAETLYSGLAPGFVGLYQINFRVWDQETAGTKPVFFWTPEYSSNLVPLHVR